MRAFLLLCANFLAKVVFPEPGKPRNTINPFTDPEDLDGAVNFELVVDGPVAGGCVAVAVAAPREAAGVCCFRCCSAI